jgi:hypothetical protein
MSEYDRIPSEEPSLTRKDIQDSFIKAGVDGKNYSGGQRVRFARGYLDKHPLLMSALSRGLKPGVTISLQTGPEEKKTGQIYAVAPFSQLRAGASVKTAPLAQKLEIQIIFQPGPGIAQSLECLSESDLDKIKID